jgi:hypothetical protein
LKVYLIASDRPIEVVEATTLSVSAISSLSVSNQTELQKPAAAPVPAQSAAELPKDAVSLSPAAQKASGGGDPDHDGH